MEMGPTECGIDNSAFCEQFNAPSKTKGRAGELDPELWSGSRLMPTIPTAGDDVFPIGKGTVPACRDGLPASVFPDEDTLICPPNDKLKSSHLLMVAAAQNYGQNSYRIRRPFDFAGRTGKIVFDAEAFMEGSLLGWVAISVVQDPMSAPSFAKLQNDEGGTAPRAGFTILLQEACQDVGQAIGLRMVTVFKDYQQTYLTPPNRVCLKTARQQLNHFEVRVAQKQLEVLGTDVSADGVSFGSPQSLFSTAIDLPFTRGYVVITTHNHATIKYGGEALDAWTSRWDNVAFDGPRLTTYREYEIPDSLRPGVRNEGKLSIGYLVLDVAQAPADVLTFKGVDLEGAKTAKLSFSSWYDQAGTVADFGLKYRLNGGAWKDRKLTAAEVAVLKGPNSQGALGQVIDLDLADLVAGDNTLEFASENVPQNYKVGVANIDLVLGLE